MPGLTRFGISLPEELVTAFDERIQRKGYKNRSEAIRDLMREELVGDEWQDGGEVVGTVTIVYDHETRELPQALTEIQHQVHGAVLCTTHVHLDEHNCLEVIIVRGDAQSVRDIADRLISAWGVKHGKLVCTTTGKQVM